MKSRVHDDHGEEYGTKRVDDLELGVPPDDGAGNRNADGLDEISEHVQVCGVHVHVAALGFDGVRSPVSVPAGLQLRGLVLVFVAVVVPVPVILVRVVGMVDVAML
eukprot:CAMPEP_0119502526 /NCGR_PEP_ID=MMETSP1344-20130328/23968_1 /TAXON_ID=236787 /ORGANISM="Florenciella parvula, Strain CCMP2471" /LENGTH=105 /DNA_ID=CAMNT_0007538743 /DNA_START=419 /DNA_END=733 /DNA_ORIENTATION=-